MCLANGTWSEKTDYSNCSMFEPILEVKNGDYSDIIYMVGYAVSLIALSIALFIFLKFRYCILINNFTFYKLFLHKFAGGAIKCVIYILYLYREMRCLRNKIHINLFCTFIFTNSWWFISLIIQVRFEISK